MIDTLEASKNCQTQHRAVKEPLCAPLEVYPLQEYSPAPSTQRGLTQTKAGTI